MQWQGPTSPRYLFVVFGKFFFLEYHKYTNHFFRSTILSLKEKKENTRIRYLFVATPSHPDPMVHEFLWFYRNSDGNGG
jgi:hypothetical protein